MKAARSIVPKRVFYVGNLDVECKETHIKTMLEQLNIAVKTVNKLGKDKDKEKDMVKDTNNDKVDDTTVTKVPWFSAFRVCIEAKDEARFLDESIWPNDVVIRNWNFNPKSSNVPNVPNVPKAKQPNQRMSPGGISYSNNARVGGDDHVMDYDVNSSQTVTAEYHVIPPHSSTSWGDTEIVLDNISLTQNGS